MRINRFFYHILSQWNTVEESGFSASSDDSDDDVEFSVKRKKYEQMNIIKQLLQHETKNDNPNEIYIIYNHHDFGQFEIPFQIERFKEWARLIQIFNFQFSNEC